MIKKLPPPSSVFAERKAVVNPNEAQKDTLTRLEKVALQITNRVGTMGFFLLIFGWTLIWLSWNFLAPKDRQFDPPMAFVFYLFISNVIQIMLMPLIMVGQNLQGRHSEIRAESDFEVNVKAEREITVILTHLEHQNEILYAMMEKIGMNVDEALKTQPDDTKGN